MKKENRVKLISPSLLQEENNNIRDDLFGENGADCVHERCGDERQQELGQEVEHDLRHVDRVGEGVGVRGRGRRRGGGPVVDRRPALAVQVVLVVELQTKVHTKLRNHGEGPY